MGKMVFNIVDSAREMIARESPSEFLFERCPFPAAAEP